MRPEEGLFWLKRFFSAHTTIPFGWTIANYLSTYYLEHICDEDGSKVRVQLPQRHLKFNAAERIETKNLLAPLVEEEKVVEKIMRYEPDYFCDVGFHRGFYVELAAQVGAKVVGFEANPDNFEPANQRLGHQTNLHNKAVYDDTSLELGIRGCSGESKVTTEGDTVNTVQLDEFFSGQAKPTMIKIDVEGAEMHVLRGMKGILEFEQPVIFLEIHKYCDGFDHTPEDAVEYLQSFGYRCQKLHSNRRDEILEFRHD